MAESFAEMATRGRFVRNVLDTCWTGPDALAIRAVGKSAPMIVPGFLGDFLGHCHEFRTLNQHLAGYAEYHRLTGMQRDAVVRWIPEMIRHRALLSENDVLEILRVQRASPASPAKIDAVAIPTGQRPDMLRRCIGSYLANFRAAGRSPRFVVADNSRSPEAAEANRALMVSMADSEKIRIHYAGPAWHEKYVEAVAAEAGCDPAVVRLALGDPENAGFAAGANRNLLLLELAGEPFFSTDDDMVCRIVSAESEDAPPIFASDPEQVERQFFPDRSAALGAARGREADLLGLHEAVTGADPAAFARMPGAGIDRLSDGFLRMLLRPVDPIIGSFGGVFLDPGVPTSSYFLWLGGSARAAFTSSRALFEATLCAPEVLFVPRGLLVGDITALQGGSFSVDGRRFLPPYFPAFHAEDFSYPAALLKCHPQALTALLPVAVHHDAARSKPVLHPSKIGEGNRAPVFEFAHLLRVFMAQQPVEASPGDPEESCRRLGYRVLAFARGTARDFSERFRSLVMQVASGQFVHAEEIMAGADDAPDYWREAHENLVDQLRLALAEPDFDIPYDLRNLRGSGEVRGLIWRVWRRYGELLVAWPDIVAAARALRDRGIAAVPAVTSRTAAKNSQTELTEWA